MGYPSLMFLKDLPEEVINAIHSYFVDMGVRIEDTTQGLYYHVPD